MQGHTDVDLSDEGRHQASLLAARFVREQICLDAVYSSDLKRAYFTGSAVADALGLEVEVDCDLRETCLGEWEGLTSQEIEQRGDAELLRLYRQDSYVNRPPGAESMDAVWNRINEAGRRICAAYPSGRVAIAGHGGSLRALICSALGAPVSSMKHIWLSNAGLSIIEVTGLPERPFERVTLLNDTSHLSSE